MGSSCDCRQGLELSQENYIRDIIMNLKICKIKFTQLKKLLRDIFGNKEQFAKFAVKDKFQKLFFDKNLNNNYLEFHEKIFDEMFFCLDDRMGAYHFLLFCFPLLIHQKDKENLYFFELIKDLFGNELSYKNLYCIMITIFEFYTFKVSKVIETFTKSLEVKRKISLLTKFSFNYEVIDRAVKNILEQFYDPEKEYRKYSSTYISEALKDKKIYNFSDIRDCVLEQYQTKNW